MNGKSSYVYTKREKLTYLIPPISLIFLDYILYYHLVGSHYLSLCIRHEIRLKIKFVLPQMILKVFVTLTDNISASLNCSFNFPWMLFFLCVKYVPGRKLISILREQNLMIKSSFMFTEKKQHIFSNFYFIYFLFISSWLHHPLISRSQYES